MSRLRETYQTIADILSFTTSNTSLEATLSSTDVDWDAIVVHGSRQLVIPTIYCRLKQRQLIHLLPEDLDLYLHDITSQNRKRNKAILKEVTMLSILFKKHHVEHVFLKGAALLAGGYYEDIAERMIGDIDILVATNHLDKAFELLQQHSFKPLPLTLTDKYFYHRHLPRLTTNKYIAAVELHRKLFNINTKEEISNELLLKNKRIPNDVFVPSAQHLVEHNILNHQINDHGYRYHRFSFRTVYDTLILHKNNSLNQLSGHITKELCNNKYICNHFKKTNIFFNDFKNEYSKQDKFFRFWLNNPKLNYWKNIFTARMDIIKILANRLIKSLSNTDYRCDLWNDRKRVIENLKAKF